jgi:hypothetical protein
MINADDNSQINVRMLEVIVEQDVSSRTIERHEGAVSRMLHDRLATPRANRGILVQRLMADGLIRDDDIVKE